MMKTLQDVFFKRRRTSIQRNETLSTSQERSPTESSETTIQNSIFFDKRIENEHRQENDEKKQETIKSLTRCNSFRPRPFLNVSKINPKRERKNEHTSPIREPKTPRKKTSKRRKKKNIKNRKQAPAKSEAK